MAHPEAHLVSANLINSALSNWLHYHTNAIHAYLPDPNPLPGDSSTPLNWRPSLLPTYPKSSLLSSPWYFPEVLFGGFNTGDPGAPPFNPHRWLPLPSSSSDATSTVPSEKNLLLTPILGAAYDAENGIHHQWAIAAQEHYSFFTNLENNRLDLYWVGNRDGVWNLQYQRHNLNFVAVWGDNVRADPPGVQDEVDLFVTIPKRLGKRKHPSFFSFLVCYFFLVKSFISSAGLDVSADYEIAAIIDTHSLVAHFSFWPQEKELLTTDLLRRYAAYAEEKVCKK
jgi:hypothetical protein